MTRLFRESDTYVTARVLSAAIEKLSPFDLLLFGTRSSDSDTGHVGPQTAQMLELPYVSNVYKLEDPDTGQHPGETAGRWISGTI